MNKLWPVIFLLVYAHSISAQDLPFQTGHTNDILEVKFNGDATKLLSYSAGDSWLILWDVQNGRQLWRTRTEFIQKATEYYTILSFAFNSDESLIASGSLNGTVQLFDAKTGRPLWRSEAHRDAVTTVGFSPDSKTIVSAASSKEGDDEIKILRTQDGQIVKKLQGRSCTVAATSFSADGKTLKTGSLDGNVTQWDLETGAQIRSKSIPSCGVRRTHDWETSYTSDLSITVKRTGGEELRIIDTKTGNSIKKIRADGGLYIRSRISADGKTLAFSKSGDFVILNLQTGVKRQIDMFDVIGSTFDISKNGNLFAEGGGWGDAAIKITEIKTGKSHFLDGHPSTVKTIAYSTDGRLLAVSGSDKYIHIYDNENRAWRKPLSGHSGPINSIAFSPDGKTLISCSEDKRINIWNWREGNLIRDLRYEEDVSGIKKISISPDGLLFLMISDRGDFRLWSTQSGEILQKSKTDDIYVSSDTIYGRNSLNVVDAAFSRDGKTIIAAHPNGILRIWSTNDGEPLNSINLGQQISSIQLSPDDRQILAAVGVSDETQVRLFDVAARKEIARFDSDETKYLEALSFSPDGKYFATSNVIGEAFLWKLDEPKPVHKLDIGHSSNDSIAFSPDGKNLSIGGMNQNLFLFDVATGECIWKLIPAYVPSDLEAHLNEEKEQKQNQLRVAKEHRDKQIPAKTAEFGKQIYVTFEHYGEMKNPDKLRRIESGEPNKSKAKKPAAQAHALWMRLHNDSPLPIKIPTQTLYQSNPNCYYSFGNNRKLAGLCNDMEVSIWFRRENAGSEPSQHGFSYIPTVFLLPKTSILFPIPKEALTETNSVKLDYIFQEETDENDIDDYGAAITLRIRASDLPQE